MLFCQLTQARSLREISDGLKCCEGKLKQQLKIQAFVGATANAVCIQIRTALIAVLIVRYLQRMRCSPTTLSSVSWMRFVIAGGSEDVDTRRRDPAVPRR